jgi:hypothetical protein
MIHGVPVSNFGAVRAFNDSTKFRSNIRNMCKLDGTQILSCRRWTDFFVQPRIFSLVGSLNK